ncbi:PaaX family transcriptional regulator C-terminal domain-containing protein [Falsiroseomonas sp. CW058]|uniref:PaaX family transcriptional regulator C-terminal domain-containing protein n=1 Tax=Falsiroseomonas sp. CW058 TaxID=3388664 RepID=UPI003D31CF11
MTASPLAATLARTGAPRTASFIVTIWGDAVAPRGGSLWLGSLQAILDRFGCNPGQVRTAMSRLTEEGWLARNRVGRLSYYRLGPRGMESFGAAAARIYAITPPAWDGVFRLVLNPDPAEREALLARGFGELPGLLVGLHGAAEELPHLAPVLLATPRSAEEARAAAAQAWPLAVLGAGHRRFLAAFAPLHDAAVPAGEALPLRLLLVHEWRRLALRDPLLPAALLPPDWPGHAARELAAALYRRLDPAAEAWLDAEGRNEDGRLPPSDAHRFGAG